MGSPRPDPAARDLFGCSVDEPVDTMECSGVAKCRTAILKLSGRSSSSGSDSGSYRSSASEASMP